jgi:hypothetical protein
MSHTPWSSVSVCEEGEPPREERTTAPLHLHRKQRTSLWHGARAHESYSLGVGLHVRRRRTTTRGANRRASSSPPKAVDQPLTRGPGPTSHTPWASASECEEGESSRRSKPPPAVVRLFTSAETNSPVSDMGTWAHGSSSLGAGSWVQRS